MANCDKCEDQAKMSRHGRPHEFLDKMDAARVFTGAKPRGFEEQDYQCQVCKAKFTHTTNKNDLAWTLWQG